MVPILAGPVEASPYVAAPEHTPGHVYVDSSNNQQVIPHTEQTRIITSGEVVIDFTVGQHWKLTVNANVAITLIAPMGSPRCQLKLSYTGVFTPTFVTAIKWPSTTTPTWTKVDGKTDLVELYYDGAAWWGASLLNFTT